ncbi:MAG: GyrI-like domain-containing protein [Planctomycetota bacterium]
MSHTSQLARRRRARSFGTLGSLWIAITLGAWSGCASGPGTTSATVGPEAPPRVNVYAPGIPVSHPPFTVFHASWKTRADAHYVYFEHYGSYAETGSLIPSLLRELAAQGLEDDGPPFALFYDDPAVTPVDQLRSRVCVPISGARSPRSPLRYEVLPQCNVAYAVVSGAYSEAPRAYPKLFEYMETYNWEVDGPIRETYVVPPTGDRKLQDLMCEIQVPVATRR